MTQIAFDLDLDDGGDPTYTVSELAEAINGALHRRFSDGLWVRGEIQGWSKSAAGHIYFNIVEIDDRGAKSTVWVAFFASSQHGPRERFRRAGLKLGDGLKVRIFGGLDFFAGSGQVTFKMVDIDPRFTLGEMAIQRDEVVRRLIATGLYDANRRCALAVAPLRVGVVTSLASAAWADFLHEIERSALGFRLVVADVRVQGEHAVAMVTAGITTLARRDDLDVIVLIRGGGARTELATFDHESIAVAIASSDVPVLTGLGHEIDRSVADEVAHRALKTPTACATALVERVAEYLAIVENTWQAITQRATRAVDRHHGRLDEIATTTGDRVRTALDRSDERLHHRASRVRDGARRVVDRADHQLATAVATLARTPARLDAESRQLDALQTHVRLLDPSNVLARGFSITRGPDGRAVRDAAALSPGDRVVT
ncbi:MAG: exodeoxyribonuclease VII large subunit, partial [Actinobacteria bacterium]|nr:exodeoxyribonuclease VII large subunit [Actinomycetota bacterium]